MWRRLRRGVITVVQELEEEEEEEDMGEIGKSEMRNLKWKRGMRNLNF
jgi:hypothetical protein